MIENSSKQERSLSGHSWALLALLAATTLFLGGCAGTQPYRTVAYQPASLKDVQVKVSLSTQNVYVEEGNRLLMATPTCVGRSGCLTSAGKFRVTLKNQYKRSETYGYWVRGSEAREKSDRHAAVLKSSLVLTSLAPCPAPFSYTYDAAGSGSASLYRLEPASCRTSET